MWKGLFFFFWWRGIKMLGWVKKIAIYVIKIWIKEIKEKAMIPWFFPPFLFNINVWHEGYAAQKSILDKSYSSKKNLSVFFTTCLFLNAILQYFFISVTAYSKNWTHVGFIQDSFLKFSTP